MASGSSPPGRCEYSLVSGLIVSRSYGVRKLLSCALHPRLGGRSLANTTRIESAIKNRELLEERRELIISTATKLFMDRGYDDVSVNEVADAMGVSIGSLYKYVRSKEDILWLVMDSIYGQLENLLKAERAVAAGPRDALLHAFERYLRAVDSVRRGILLMYREYRNLPSTPKRSSWNASAGSFRSSRRSSRKE